MASVDERMKTRQKVAFEKRGALAVAAAVVATSQATFSENRPAVFRPRWKKIEKYRASAPEQQR